MICSESFLPGLHADIRVVVADSVDHLNLDYAADIVCGTVAAAAMALEISIKE